MANELWLKINYAEYIYTLLNWHQAIQPRIKKDEITTLLGGKKIKKIGFTLLKKFRNYLKCCCIVCRSSLSFLVRFHKNVKHESESKVEAWGQTCVRQWWTDRGGNMKFTWDGELPASSLGGLSSGGAELFCFLKESTQNVQQTQLMLIIYAGSKVWTAYYHYRNTKNSPSFFVKLRG